MSPKIEKRYFGAWMSSNSSCPKSLSWAKIANFLQKLMQPVVQQLGQLLNLPACYRGIRLLTKGISGVSWAGYHTIRNLGSRYGLPTAITIDCSRGSNG